MQWIGLLRGCFGLCLCGPEDGAHRSRFLILKEVLPMNQTWHEHETIHNHGHSLVMATQGYVLGIEISSAGMQMSVALADLQGQIVYRTRKRLSAPPEGQA